MVTKAKILLGNERLCHHRKTNSEQGGQNCNRRKSRIYPDDRSRRQGQLESTSKKLPAKVWHQVNPVNAVAAFSRVGNGTAPKVTVPKLDDLAQKLEAQAHFEMSPHTENAIRKKEFQQENQTQESQQRRYRSQPLAWEA